MSFVPGLLPCLGPPLDAAGLLLATMQCARSKPCLTLLPHTLTWALAAGSIASEWLGLFSRNLRSGKYGKPLFVGYNLNDRPLRHVSSSCDSDLCTGFHVGILHAPRAFWRRS